MQMARIPVFVFALLGFVVSVAVYMNADMGVAPYDAVVFGDASNDLSMFTDDGWIKVAMGNAIPELKAKADYVTTDVDKDDIYNACVHLSLFASV